VGRDGSEPESVKPSPRNLREGASFHKAPRDQCVVVGVSTADIRAAIAAGMHSFGHANKLGKVSSLANAGAYI